MLQISSVRCRLMTEFDLLSPLIYIILACQGPIFYMRGMVSCHYLGCYPFFLGICFAWWDHIQRLPIAGILGDCGLDCARGDWGLVLCAWILFLF